MTIRTRAPFSSFRGACAATTDGTALRTAKLTTHDAFATSAIPCRRMRGSVGWRRATWRVAVRCGSSTIQHCDMDQPRRIGRGAALLMIGSWLLLRRASESMILRK
jgi:hypothetical protein